ncbi:MAG: hypothetical protein ACK496_20050 [Acidobacteriota bacterium]
MKTLLLLVMALLATPGVTAQDNDRFSGIYANQQYNIVVQIRKSTDGYVGEFIYQGAQYPLTANANRRPASKSGQADQLSGVYSFQGRQVPFSLSGQDESYTLSSEGVELAVVRQPLPASRPAPAQSSSPRNPTGAAPTPGESLLRDPGGAFTCTLPAGWQATPENGGFILRHRESPVTMIISSHNENDIDRAIAQASDINNPQENTQIRVQARKLSANIAYARFAGSARQQPVNLELVTVFSPYGGGMVVTVNYGSYSPNPDYLTIARAIADSVRFARTETPPLARQWTDRLTGRKLLFLQTDSYGSQRVDLNLYANGRFDYQSNTGMVSQGGVGTGTYGGLRRDAGTWKITLQGNNPVLILNGSEGTTSYTIANGASPQQLLLNNRRYFLQPLP